MPLVFQTALTYAKVASYNFSPDDSSSSQKFPQNPVKIHSCWKRTVESDYVRINCKKGSSMKSAYFDYKNYNCKYRWLDCGERYLVLRKSGRIRQFFPLASAEEGVTVNGSPQASISTEVKDMRVKLNQSLQGDNYSDGLVQFLHDVARIFELVHKEKGSVSKLSWFSTAWLGVDRNAWLKTLSYQAAVYSLLQAASQISSRGDSRERDTNIFVLESLSRQSARLESLIREKLSAKQPEAYDWFWSENVPEAVSSFIAHFEVEPRFAAATAMPSRGTTLAAGNASDTSLVILALTCLAAITKLGPAKVCCPHFFSMIPDITGRLMDMLVDFVSINQAFRTITEIGLQTEFLAHFGPRAAACRVKKDCDSEEVDFWVNLVQRQLQKAVAREKIWSRLTTSESIEVLERDLSIFGFFIALGRSAQSFLSVNGFDDIEEPVEGLIRYLIGGSVLYYPQLSAISSYQLYVEVVCEELDWLPFYPGIGATLKQSHGYGSEREVPPNIEAIPELLDVCSHWIQSFIKYSRWAENPSNVKAARFLSRGHNKLIVCMEELGISKGDKTEACFVGRSGSPVDKEADSFDKALESVDEALKRLETLLQELHVSGSDSGKEQLKAACSDLEKIRKLKKEAEFFEVSFRAKAASLRQDVDDSNYQSTGDKNSVKGKTRKNASLVDDKGKRLSKSRGLLNLLKHSLMKKPASKAAVEKPGNQLSDENVSSASVTETQPSEILRFEALRNELMELEKRVQRSADQSQYEGDNMEIEDLPDSICNNGLNQLVKVEKKANIIEKSLDKLKETSTDVLQGTQLLAIDVAAAMGLFRRTIIGDELTEKEKKALQRTLTDLASVIPIGFLMLLPVTAVGHAAMLAAIQRYVPALIPSTYGPQRLDLLRQLEKTKQIEASEVDPEEIADERTE